MTSSGVRHKLNTPVENIDTNGPSHKQILKAKKPVNDHFKEKGGIKYAGEHLIIDVWDATHLDDLTLIEDTLRHAVEVSGATLLHIHLHHFTPTGGVSGVAVLAESHISVHTWPEKNYAAFDVFMCGDTEPEKTISIFQKAFCSNKIEVKEILRGIEL
jgi:S-adenosylmethionine decarboxylase